jgi:hypothetical protein
LSQFGRPIRVANQFALGEALGRFSPDKMDQRADNLMGNAFKARPQFDVLFELGDRPPRWILF